MHMKDAVAAAKACVIELFADESVGNVGLEEVSFDPDQALWWVTIGFSRPWQLTIGFMPVSGQGPGRCYKVIAISDPDGRVVSVRDRDLSP
jgi:hypothetical protein